MGADITFGSIGSRVRSTVDLLIDRPWKCERLIRQQAIPADNTRAPSVLSRQRETNTYLRRLLCAVEMHAHKMLPAFLALANENGKDKVISGNRIVRSGEPVSRGLL